MIKALLFDLDGTLIDTNELIYVTFTETFEKYNKKVTREELKEFFGIPLEEALSHYPDIDGEKFIRDYRERNQEIHDDMVTVYNGTKEALEYFKEKGIKLGIVSSKRYDMVVRGLKLFGLDSFFESMIVSESTKIHKPKPDPVLKALEELNVKPEEAIMVGDSVYDLMSGNAAGTYSIGVSYSTFETKRLEECNPTAIVDNIIEIKDIIKEINAKE